jgi:hypothetical protein
MAPRLLLFAGAPEAGSLDWQEPGLLDSFIDPIARFAGLSISSDQQIISITPDLTSTSAAQPSWRSLPLERQHLTTGLTQSFDRHHLFTGITQQKDSQGASFLVTSQVSSFIEELSQAPGAESHASSLESAEQVLSQFYEESYARHEDVQSSQIAPASDMCSSFTSDEFSASFDSPLRPFRAAKDIPIAGHLNNLRDVPNAVYLNSIHPQTMTVNLIIGIISIPEPRAIKTRRGAPVELIEVLAGDETKSGFGINFWLSSSQSAQGDMRSLLSGLRPRDVVLIRNVALSSFRGKVYGQSLRKDMTKVHLLYRNRVDKNDVGGCYSAADLAVDEPAPPQVERTRRVREWVLKFVGAGTAQQKGKGRAFEAVKEVLPPDTQ